MKEKNPFSQAFGWRSGVIRTLAPHVLNNIDDVIDNYDLMKFVVIEEYEDEAIFPVARQLIYKKESASTS